MLNYFQAVVLGLMQGVTELFPISSLGHSVVLPRLLGWNINQKDPFFLTFLVATHTATALVLLVFFRKDWVKIVKGLLNTLKKREIKEADIDGKLAWLLVVTTIPAGILGLLFEESFKSLFADPQLVAGVLILNGVLLYMAEILRRKRKEEYKENNNQQISKLKWTQAVKIGLLQCIALIPGFSRTGATLAGGLFEGLSHTNAARFSFLLATPIIAAASLLKLPELLTQTGFNILPSVIIGAISSGIAAYFSVKFLTKYFKTEKLTPFAIYCSGLGIILFLIFLFR